jgi:hypothetical protein
MKLNMGCGQNRRDGYVNVDAEAACGPDVVWNLEHTPWPWDDGVAAEVLFNHSLEHMGASSSVFLAMMSELYRICRTGAVVDIIVPHPRHDDFLGDPTHVRAVTPAMMQLFSRAANEHWRANGASNTPFALYLGVDFETVSASTVLAEPFASQLKSGELTQQQAAEAVRLYNNVAAEYWIKLKVNKP